MKKSDHRNVLEIPSARALREIIYSKRNSKRKAREGSTDVYFLKRTYIDAVTRQTQQ